jgi:hypothetical protein
VFLDSLSAPPKPVVLRVMTLHGRLASPDGEEARLVSTGGDGARRDVPAVAPVEEDDVFPAGAGSVDQSTEVSMSLPPRELGLKGRGGGCVGGGEGAGVWWTTGGGTGGDACC